MNLQAIEASSLPLAAGYLQGMVDGHPASSHSLFVRLREGTLTSAQAVRLLSNYDAHAALLRRLLLSAAAAMPEPAVGFILENVRNEYGNGNYTLCHENLLADLIELTRADGEHAIDSGVPQPPALDMASVEFRLKLRERNGTLKDKNGSEKNGRPEPNSQLSLEEGVREYISKVPFLYSPGKSITGPDERFYKPAITAGAVTATEIMALVEFQAMKEAFQTFGLASHPWFDHVNVESEHSEESLALAGYFIVNHQAKDAVEYGLMQTLDVNVLLYDGLLATLSGC